MIDVHSLTNATPVALFGMFALWAAVSNRHWFVRTAVVASAILITLLIPAYEVVIMLTVETAVVVIGMAIWRRRRRANNDAALSREWRLFPLRLSMETLMLSVVIIATITTLAARWPAIRPESWYQFALNGAHSGVVALICVWLVCGRAAWWIRLLTAAAPLAIFMSFTLTCLRWAGHIASYYFRVNPGSMQQYLEVARRDIWPATLSWTISVALGMAILCAWLFLMIRAGWFDPFGETAAATPEKYSRRTQTAARLAAWGLFGIASIFPLFLFYKLLTPPPLPAVQPQGPNGFEDFLAAGRVISPAAARTLRNWTNLSTPQLEAGVNAHLAALERAEQGLQKPCWNPFVYRDWTQEDSFALLQLLDVLSAQAELARRKNDIPLLLRTNMTFLKIAQEEARGTGADFYDTIFADYEPTIYESIWQYAQQVPVGECRELVDELRDLESSREPWQNRVERQRIIDENADWETHLERLLADWSGRESYSWQTDMEFRHVAQLRMLIIKLAIHAFQADRGKMPYFLSQLVPEYLPELPNDPFTDSPFSYHIPFRGDGTHYIRIYSFGPDRDDDNGIPMGPGSDEGDLTDAENFFPPPPPPTTGATPAP